MAINNNTLGAAVKNVRLARELTQEQLARAVGMAKGSIALVEQGRRSVSMETLNRLALALDIPPACLTILGSGPVAKNKEASEFMESLQKLISTIVLAQARSAVEEKGEESKQETVQAESRRFHELAGLFRVAAKPKVKPKPKKAKAKERGLVGA
jgi:transcriptional regulator with XRE-family HTH domain